MIEDIYGYEEITLSSGKKTKEHQEDEETSYYNKISNIKTARGLHMIHNTLEGGYEKKSYISWRWSIRHLLLKTK